MCDWWCADLRLSPTESKANTTIATWELTIPAAERLTEARLWRAGDKGGTSTISAFDQFGFAGPMKKLDPEETFGLCGTTCPSVVGTFSEPQAKKTNSSCRRLVLDLTST